jgi:hypothetical protein
MSECESAENARYLEKIYNVSKSVTRGRSSGDSTLAPSPCLLSIYARFVCIVDHWISVLCSRTLHQKGTHPRRIIQVSHAGPQGCTAAGRS